MIQGYADFMYQVGLLDERQREVFRNATNQGLQFIKEKKWIEADEARHVLQLHRSIKQIKSDWNRFVSNALQHQTTKIQ